MTNHKIFQHQFVDINPAKLARRQQFLRKVQNRVQHRFGRDKTPKLLKRRLTKQTLI